MTDHKFDNVMEMLKGVANPHPQVHVVCELEYGEGDLESALELMPDEDITPEFLTALDEFVISSFMKGFEGKGISTAQMDDIDAAQDFLDDHGFDPDAPILEATGTEDIPGL